MKAYTNVEQGRKLAEILPLDTADMFHLESDSNDVKLMWEHIGPKVTNPCWSLASLIEVLPLKVCAEFADNINGLIDVIAINSISTVTYIHNTFG